jgi:hypothetical protein
VFPQSPNSNSRPSFAFIIVGVLSAAASLFLVEAMSNIRGNENFQAQVEFSTVAELCLGKRSHVILQIILYLALQSVNISSIIISTQVSRQSKISISGLIRGRLWTQY